MRKKLLVNAGLLAYAATFALFVTLPLTGFLYGFFHPNADSIGMRIFFGVLFAVLVTLTFGSAPHDEAGIHATDLRLHALILFAVLTVVAFTVLSLIVMMSEHGDVVDGDLRIGDGAMLPGRETDLTLDEEEEGNRL